MFCKKCLTEKETTEFYKNNTNKSGFQYSCKDCVKKYQLENREHIYARNLGWSKKNPEKTREYARRAREKHPERCKEYARSYYLRHRDKILAKMNAKNAAKRGE
jgi:fructose-1,6-bisphosphatase